LIAKSLSWLRDRRSASPRFPDGLAPWRVVGASTAGTSHQKLGQACQDAAGWALGPERSLIVAVADGAGSASHGGEGARLAVSTAVNFLSNRRTLGSPNAQKDALVSALERARSALQSDAGRRGVTARDMATTLILLQATPDSVAALQVGDGAAVVNARQNGPTGVTSPQTGEYINETMFITAADAMDHHQTVCHGYGLTGGAVFSDGLQMLALKMPEGTPHPPFFGPLLRFVADATDAGQADAALRSFLASPRVTGQTTDDLTLVLFALDASPAGE